MTEPVAKNDLLIRQKCEAMIEYGHIAIRQFPKMERHVLGAEIRTTMWSLLRLIVICNKRHYKKTTLQDLDAELDLLRSQVLFIARGKFYHAGAVAMIGGETWVLHNDQGAGMVVCQRLRDMDALYPYLQPVLVYDDEGNVVGTESAARAMPANWAGWPDVPLD